MFTSHRVGSRSGLLRELIKGSLIYLWPWPWLSGLQRLCVVILLGLLSWPVSGVGDTVDPHVIMERMAAAYDEITDYSALFLKRERINGRLRPLEKIELRFQEPFKVYLGWVEPNKGRVVVYVEGENENKMLVNPGGLLKYVRLALEPSSYLAKRDAHHSILQAGIQNTIAHVMKEYRRGMELNQVTAHFRGQAEVDGRLAYHLEFIYPADPSAGYYAYRGEIWIDQEYYLPTRLRIYNWDNELYEYYEYHRLQLNPGLDETAFRLAPLEGTAPQLEVYQ